MIPPQIYADSLGISWSMIRSSGPGGQHVNKVSTAMQLRFNIHHSKLHPDLQAKLLSQKDHRLTTQGIFLIKAQNSRSQEQNKADALERLNQWISQNVKTAKKRKPTKPTRASQKRRLDSKKKNSNTKALRRERF